MLKKVNRDRVAVLQRIHDYVDRYKYYMGRKPHVIILFAEDYDAILDDAPRLTKRYGFRLERGPSVEEYAFG